MKKLLLMMAMILHSAVWHYMGIDRRIRWNSKCTMDSQFSRNDFWFGF